MDEAKLVRNEHISEVEAFFDKCNYFRKPVSIRNEMDTGWLMHDWYAGDRIVMEALNGKRSIGLRANRTTSFIGFDIDTVGKNEPEGIEQKAVTDETLVGEKADQGVGQSEIADKDEVRGWEEWAHWEESGITGVEEPWEELSRALAGGYEYVEAHKTNRIEGSRGGLYPELRVAVQILLDCFTEMPSLVVRSPHGVHVYWCLNAGVRWYSEIKPKLEIVKEEWEACCREKGITNRIEVLPTPTKGLRIPRKDRLIEPKSLEPMDAVIDGEAFWKELKQYSFETLIKNDVLQHERIHAENGVPKGRSKGNKGSKGRSSIAAGPRDDEWTGQKPKTKDEAERFVMPFRNGETNSQLIAMIEAGKRDGMTVGAIIDWLRRWVLISKGEGYTGNLTAEGSWFEARVNALFDRCNVLKSNMRWVELWEEEKGKHERNEELARDLLERLESINPIASRSKPTVMRFLGDIDIWRRVIDSRIINQTAGSIDKSTRANHSRGMYPLPYSLLRRMYSSYTTVWEGIQSAGIISIDTEKQGSYVPDIGRPQYYHLDYINL